MRYASQIRTYNILNKKGFYRFNMTSPALIILGMHRSGTSCLAGSLQQAGLFCGDVVESAPYNKKGNRENLDIMALNTAIMQHNDGDWDSPTEITNWSDGHVIERDKIIQALSSDTEHLWGFKDPRTMFTLPFWQAGISDFLLTASYRHPLAVASSLQARNNFTIEKGLALWKRYNLRLLSYLQDNEFPVICFDVTRDQYEKDINRITNAFELENSLKQEKFYSDVLINQSSKNQSPLPADIQSIYDELNTIYSSQSGSI